MWVLFFFHWRKFDLIYFMWVCLLFFFFGFFVNFRWTWILGRDVKVVLNAHWLWSWMSIKLSCLIRIWPRWILVSWRLSSSIGLPCISSWSDPYPSLSFSLVGQPSNWWRSSPCKVWPHQSWNTEGLSRVRQDSFARSLCQFLWSIGELLLFPNEFASSLPFLSFVKVSECFIFRLCPMEVEVLYLAMWVVLMLCLQKHIPIFRSGNTRYWILMGLTTLWT